MDRHGYARATAILLGAGFGQTREALDEIIRGTPRLRFELSVTGEEIVRRAADMAHLAMASGGALVLLGEFCGDPSYGPPRMTLDVMCDRADLTQAYVDALAEARRVAAAEVADAGRYFGQGDVVTP